MAPSWNVLGPFGSGQLSADQLAQPGLPRRRGQVSEDDLLAGSGQRVAVWAEDGADPSLEGGVGAASVEVVQDDR